MSRCFLFAVILSLVAGGGQEENGSPRAGGLPVWITSNPAYQSPMEVDAIKEGNGSLTTGQKKSLAWVVHLNEKVGHGVQVEVEKLSLDPSANDFLMLAPWPITSSFQQVKLFTGTLVTSTQVHIPNTKSFVLLYSVSANTKIPTMLLHYRRYGVSYEPRPPPTDRPEKRETIFEVQLKGKPKDEYLDSQFLNKVKEAMRAAAQRYSLAHNIQFNSNIPTQEMVSIRRISCCPFEWPERETCTSLEHSIYVSGVRVSEDLIVDYQLTADHLRQMWLQDAFPELEALGVTVYKLPTTSTTILWWSLIIGLMVASSLIAALTFWRMIKYRREISSRKSSLSFEPVATRKRSKLKLAKHQEIPPFMFSSTEVYSQEEKYRAAFGEDLVRDRGQKNDSSPQDPSGRPIKDYIGGILFSDNKVYEEDEEKVEFTTESKKAKE